MSFLAPAAFFLAGLVPVIIAMYLLRLRRTERVVPSVYLWRRMVRDVEANAPWQRLRRNLLLLLQLLFLILLIFALARPFTPTAAGGGQALILILDASASMGATDVAPSRLEAARDQAHRLVESLPDSARVTVIAAGDQAQVMAASTQDRREANLAIERIQAGTGGSDLGVALELASAIAARQPDTEIVVLSDGRVSLPPRQALKGSLRYLPVGMRGENQAIHLLSLETASGGAGQTAFAQVLNYGDQPASRRLTLYADGALVNAYDLNLAPKGQQAVLAEGLPADIQMVEARLSGSDDLPSDDQAFAVRASGKPAPVALVSEGNRFLETALALLPGVEITRVEPAAISTLPPTGMTILDGYVPITTPLPAGNLLFIGPPRSSEYFTVTGKLDEPQIVVANPADPLLANVDFSEVSVLDAAKIPLPDWAHLLVNGETGDDAAPLLFAGEVDGRRIAVLSFDLHRSDLPLHIAFPLLLINLKSWLSPDQAGGLPSQVSPGEAVAFALPPDIDSVTVTYPGGERERLSVPGGQFAFAGTQALGVYRLQWGTGAQASFAVNLFSTQESDIAPALSLPALEASAQQAGAESQQGRREWWRPLALIALGVLTAEWLVYQRSALARLRGEIGSRLVRRQAAPSRRG